jgi:ketosteroid isomerase-like protein
LASANLDLVQSILAAWERGDFSSAEWAHADIEYVHADGPEPGRWTGLSGMREAAREQLSAWEEFRPDVEEFRELDEANVLVLTHRRGRGKTSGLDLGQMGVKGAHVFHVRNGKVTRLVIYFDRERALADLGLPSETDSPRT